MKKYVDMTHLMENGMITAPLSWHPPFQTEQLGAVDTHGSMTHLVSFGTHTGTHIDSPAHMIAGGKPTLEGIPLEVLLGKAKLLHIPKAAGELISAADIESTKIKLEKGDMVFIHTGADKNWNKPAFFELYPTFAADAADYLIKKEISLLGMDTPSPDRGGLPKDHPERNMIHRKILGAGIYVVEALANLSCIPATEIEAVILPLKIKGLDGCPVRAVAVYEEI